MPNSYGTWVVELSSTLGTGAYLLGGVPIGSGFRTFRQEYANGNDKVCYWVVSDDGTKREKNRFGTLTYGTPDTLTRNVVKSTDGNAPVSWVGGDHPLQVYVVPDDEAEELAIGMGFGATRPGVLKYGLWAEEDGEGTDVDIVDLFDGTSDLPAFIVDRVNHQLYGSVLKLNIQKFTSSGTYTPHAKMRFGYAVGKGAGGGGGTLSAQSTLAMGSGGGGEGGTAIKFFTRADVLPTVSVTIPAAAGSGANGGNCTFGPLLTANGGLAGLAAVGGAGGGGTGDTVIPGAPGGNGSLVTTANGNGFGGAGGGAGGAVGQTDSGSPSSVVGTAAAANSGGGGGGAASRAAGPGSVAGGNGGSGYLYVVEFLAP